MNNQFTLRSNEVEKSTTIEQHSSENSGSEHSFDYDRPVKK